jgi:hypothetical protein
MWTVKREGIGDEGEARGETILETDEFGNGHKVRGRDMSDHTVDMRDKLSEMRDMIWS